MAQIDKLISKMVQDNIDRAVLISDQPMQLHAFGSFTGGATLTRERINSILQEIIPSNLKTHEHPQGKFHFPYSSPQGVFTVRVRETASIIQVSVTHFQKPVVTTPLRATPSAYPSPSLDFTKDNDEVDNKRSTRSTRYSLDDEARVFDNDGIDNHRSTPPYSPPPDSPASDNSYGPLGMAFVGFLVGASTGAGIMVDNAIATGLFTGLFGAVLGFFIGMEKD